MQRAPASLSRLHPVALATILFLAMGAVQAQAPGGTLREVVVSGSRQEQVSDELPLTVDVLDAQEMERAQVQDIRDVARDLPNVSVRHAPSRFAITGPANNTGRDGNAGFTIRGLGGNRVLMLVDGIRVPRSYAFGGNAFGRDYVSLDLLERVEVVRGAGSALYGSDGMGGLVNFITHEPEDFLGGPRGPRTLGGRVSARYSGDDHGRGLAATLAGRASESIEWLVTAAGRRAHGLETRGDIDTPDVNRTTANPQDDRDRALLGKIVLRPGGGQKHVLTLEHVDRASDVNLLSSRAVLPLRGTAAQVAAAVLDERGSMDMTRNRLTWDGRWRLGSALADHLQVVAGLQDASSRQLGFSDLNARPDRERDVRYDERTWQLGVQADKTARLEGGWVRTVTYGLDHTRSRITNLFTGVNPLPPEVFPLKRFPDTRETGSAGYVQVDWSSERWSVVPGVRFDHFALDVLSQQGFFPPAAQPGRSLSGSAVSPKLGVMFRATPAWSLYGNYAGGFRAPNANQVNGYYENAAEFVQVIPNPDLRPEKSRTFELGARARLPRLTLDAAAFTGRFSNLIVDNVLVAGTGVAGDPKLFQTRNVERARIHGFELKGRFEAGRWAGGEWGVPFAYGVARGVNSSTGRPLNSIDPAQVAVGLEYRAARWEARIDVRHTAAKKAEDIDSPGLVKPPQTQITIPSATTVDLSAQWRIRKDLRLTGSIVNLTNRKYWTWADVQGLAASTTVADAYTQPGRHLRLSLVADF
jgi:hemoglobin/transferrin/lactoferrin receptor protein